MHTNWTTHGQHAIKVAHLCPTYRHVGLETSPTQAEDSDFSHSVYDKWLALPVESNHWDPVGLKLAWSNLSKVFVENPGLKKTEVASKRTNA